MEAEARGGGNFESLHERLGTVVSRADGDIFAVEDGGDVVWVNALDAKGENGIVGFW